MAYNVGEFHWCVAGGLSELRCNAADFFPVLFSLFSFSPRGGKEEKERGGGKKEEMGKKERERRENVPPSLFSRALLLTTCYFAIDVQYVCVVAGPYASVCKCNHSLRDKQANKPPTFFGGPHDLGYCSCNFSACHTTAPSFTAPCRWGSPCSVSSVPTRAPHSPPPPRSPHSCLVDAGCIG